MDRNIPSIGTLRNTHKVALRKESVDRNVGLSALAPEENPVALRKESVDRNATSLLVYLALVRSLSARRAWIEIFAQAPSAQALPSLSARRAWIEILEKT